ncbi:MAG: flp pilus-assembly TadE/G-like family protein [Actinomycetaceae bacterium]|nr:flp pilus-assembly TadE/G-like family protein [Actinomycetaceae bacterium]
MTQESQKPPEPTVGQQSAARNDDGSGTLLSIGVVAAILSACVAITVLLGVHVTRVHAQNGADMAALAGADLSRTGRWAAVGDQPCQQAEAAAARNHVRLDFCEIVGLDVRVEVSAEYGPWRVHARARAGPENTENLPGPDGAPGK